MLAMVQLDMVFASQTAIRQGLKSLYRTNKRRASSARRH
jgi:hypothetical protein